MHSAISLPDLDNRYEISPADVASYQKNGHILLKSVLSPEEIAVYRDIIIDAAYRYNTENRAIKDRDTYGKAFLQIMNLWEQDQDVRKFTLSKRFAQIAADLMGVERVRLYHDQALFKEAGGGPTPWHQDQYYWPLDTPHTITMWTPLGDVSVERGMLTFASQSQELGYTGDLAISDASETELSRLIEEKSYPVTRAETMKAGDVTFHAGWTLHSAPGNQSETTREVMTVIYFEDGAKVSEPRNKNQEKDRERWLMGRASGDLANSALNPLI